ncbi:hypothetical protein DRQ18_05450, partial [bacterium]
MIGILILLLGPFKGIPFVSKDYYEGVGTAECIGMTEEECIEKAKREALKNLVENIECQIVVSTKRILGDSAGKVEDRLKEFVEISARAYIPTREVQYSLPEIHEDKGVVLVRARLSKKVYQEYVERKIKENVARICEFYNSAIQHMFEEDYISAIRDLLKAKAWLFFKLHELPVEVDVNRDGRKEEIGGRIESELDHLLTHIILKASKVTYGVSGMLHGNLKVSVTLDGKPLKYFPLTVEFEKGRGTLLTPKVATGIDGKAEIIVKNIDPSSDEVILKITPDLQALINLEKFKKEGIREVERFEKELREKLRIWRIVIERRKTLALAVYMKANGKIYFPENVYDDVSEIVREKGYDVVKKNIHENPGQDLLSSLASQGIEYLLLVEIKVSLEYDDYWDVYTAKAWGKVVLYST